MIRLILPWLPPSSNAAYFNLPGKGRALNNVGRAFLKTTIAHFSQNYPREMMLFKPNKPYEIAVLFYLEHLENTGFKTGKAASRYKVLDATNRIKLLEDALKDAGGIDDSQYLKFHCEKEQGMPERTILCAWALEEESSPSDGISKALRTP